MTFSPVSLTISDTDIEQLEWTEERHWSAVVEVDRMRPWCFDAND